MTSFICFWIRITIQRVKCLEGCHAIRWCPKILWGITFAKNYWKSSILVKLKKTYSKNELLHKCFPRFLITSVVQLFCRTHFGGWFYSIIQFFNIDACVRVFPAAPTSGFSIIFPRSKRKLHVFKVLSL